MAAVAGSQLVVRLSFVTLTAERDDFPDFGRVPIVTVLAADLRLVFSACRRDVRRRFFVTFGAVGID